MASPVTVTVGHQVTCTYVILDQNGQPMLVQPALDVPATWTDMPSASGVDTPTISGDHTMDVIQAMGVGTDTVGLSVVIGGKVFTDSLMITVQAVPQVASGVSIRASVE